MYGYEYSKIKHLSSFTMNRVGFRSICFTNETNNGLGSV